MEGAKAGSNKARSAVIQDDTASSITDANVVYGLCEGEIEGLADGQRSIRLDGTPIENALGEKNFDDVEVEFKTGTLNQEPLLGFPNVVNQIDYNNIEITDDKPFIHHINDTQYTSANVRLVFGAIFKTNPNNGDTKGNTVDYAIDIQVDGLGWNQYATYTLSDKTSANYERGHPIELPPAEESWDIRVRRITPNANSQYVGDKMYAGSVAQIINARFSYPYTALIGLKYNASRFSSVAKLAIRLKGKIIRIPTNMDPVSGTYSTTGAGTTNGMWDGTFKWAYSNNPAWVYYDICLNKRYGLGNRITADKLDKWSLYTIGKYCDEQVDDGFGGKEKRFTVNVYISSFYDAHDCLLQLSGVFRGILYYNGTQLRMEMDRPRDPVYTYNLSNIIGKFAYKSSKEKDRFSVITVEYDDPALEYKTVPMTVFDRTAMRQIGVKTKKIQAFGCTSRGQAQRVAYWLLYKNLFETRSVTFKVGLEGFIAPTGRIIEIADQKFAGRANGGRVAEVSADKTTITIDRDGGKVGDRLVINGEDGFSESREIIIANGRRLTVSLPFDNIAEENAFAIDSDDLALMRFTVVTASMDQSDNSNAFTISAVQHSPEIFDKAEFGVFLDNRPITIINPDVQDPVTRIDIAADTKVVQGISITDLVIMWDQVPNAVKYAVQYQKDDGQWINAPDNYSNTCIIENVYTGIYKARVVAISASDLRSRATVSNPFPIVAKFTNPPNLAKFTATGILFGVELAFDFLDGSQNGDYTEIQVALAADKSDASTLTLVPFPQKDYSYTGLKGGQILYYRGRLVDKNGFQSDWTTWVTATVSEDPDLIMDIIKGHIGIEAIDKELADQIELANVNANEALNTANQLKVTTEASITQLNQSIDTERTERLNQAAQLQNGITQAQTTADGAISELNNYKESTNTTLANYQQSINVLTDANSANVQRINALDARVTGAETNIATALEKSQVAIDTTNALSETVRANTAAIGNKADSSYVDQVKVIADTANNTASTNATNIEALRSRVGNNESSINNINQTKADKNEVASIAQQALQSVWRADSQAQINSIKLGGRNLVLKSFANRTSHGYPFFSEALTQTLNAGEKVTVTVWGALEGGTSMSIYNSGGQVQMAVLQFIGDGQYQATFDWVIGNSSNTYIDLYALGHQDGGYTVVNKVMLERGTKGSDWTAAPEDLSLGGRNLVRNTGLDHKGFGWVFQELLVKPIVGEVTISFDAITDDGQEYGGGIGFCYGDNGTSGYNYISYPVMGKKKIVVTMSTDSRPFTHFGIYVNAETRISNVMVEMGNLASDWSPAPEDFTQSLNEFKSNVTQTYQTKAEAQSTTANLTSQIESKATVVQAQNFANDAVKNAKIGGENFIRGTQFFETSGNLKPNYGGFGTLYTDPNDRLFGTNYIYLVTSSWSGFYFSGFPDNKLQEDCVLSFWASSQNNSPVYAYAITAGTGLAITIEGAQWRQYSVALPKGTLVQNTNNQGIIEFDITAGNVLAYGAIQLQRGNKATDWAPSPLDSRVGGKNLLRNSEFKNGLEYWSIYDSEYSILDTTVNNVATKYIYLHGGQGGLYMKPADVTYTAQEGDIMTLSFSARGEGQMVVGFDDIYQLITLERNGEAFKRYSLTFKRVRNDNVIMYLRGAHVDLLRPKLELGNTATDWTPAPEDIEKTVIDLNANIVNNYSTKADTNSAIASGITEFNANLGNIKTYTASSSYLGFAGIKNARGNVLNQTWRSYGLDVFNENGDWARTYRYDVYGNAPVADELAARINECVEGETIVVTTLDEPAGNRNAAMRSAFISIGGTGAAFDNIGFRNCYLLIGKKGLREGGGIEQLTTGATIDFPMQFINGQLAAFAGSAGQQAQISANATVLSQTQALVTQHDGQISVLSQRTDTLTSTVTQAQNTANQAIVDAANAIFNKTESVDLTNSAYGQDTWYPVGVAVLSTGQRSNLSLNAFLDNTSHPNWATHSGGFSINLQWNTIGSGWGTIPIDRVINGFTYSWTDGKSPAIRIDQAGAASMEVVWLRGGGRYNLNFPKTAQLYIPDPATGQIRDPNDGSIISSMLYVDTYLPKSVDQKTTTNSVVLQQQFEVMNGIQGKYTVKINNNGYGTGFGLISEPNNGSIVSAFMIDADAFVVGKAGTNIKPIVAVVAGQTIEGVYYPESGTYLNSAWISRATIKLAHIDTATIVNLRALSASFGNFMSGTAGGARIEQNDNGQQIYDANNRLRVKIGKLN